MDNCNKPAELLQIYVNACTIKTALPLGRLSVLAVLAGAYIAFGAAFFSVAVTGTAETLGFGLSRVLGGGCFSLGLMLVVVCGGELFTGNTLMTTAMLPKKITLKGLLYNWVVVYFGNFVGALIVVAIVVYGATWTLGGNAGGVTALNLGMAKCNLGFSEALMRGIGCNWLVCLGVWMGLAGKDIMSKIWGIFFPVAAFVAIGFEHCVANMYFIPKALLLKNAPQLAEFAAAHALELENLTVHNFILGNLIPVTIGNIIGGAFFVGMLYFTAYRKT